MQQIDLSAYGIKNAKQIYHNPSFDLIREHELAPGLTGYEHGVVTQSGAVNVRTGVFTGRSPKDKYIVMDDVSRDTVWWNSPKAPNDNHPASPEVWSELKGLVAKGLSDKTLYVMDAYCGASPATRLKVRFIMEVAWQAHFVKCMFIRPTESELAEFGTPDFVVLAGSKTVNPRWKEHGLNSENFVMFNLSERMQIVGGTWYGGELKKGMFTMMNYYLPLKGIASMHSSANRGEKGDVALFFGLSGTGKTTLSTDSTRQLIGDDEHGWDDEGIFNLEGGCYAKTIDLSAEYEPEIYAAIRRDALLENVVVDEFGHCDYHDKSITENTRVAYPIYHIDNIVRPVSRAGHAKKVIFLSADAFGVLPPVSVLTPDQAKYHFLSGFTANLAGCERGVDVATPTFSACFGKAFLALHPLKYAQELVRKMEMNNATAYLVNTGWNGYGRRISIKDTRGIINAILNGSIDNVHKSVLPVFGLHFPTHLHGVNPHILDPRKTYAVPGDWYTKADKLAQLFIKNFEQYADSPEGAKLVESGPRPMHH